MGNNSSINKTDDGEITCRVDGGNICGGRVIHEILNNHTMNEIVLSKTYSYPKGTFTAESTKYLNEKEKALFHFCKGNNIAAIRYLTIKGVHINTLDEDRTSPLHIVCKSGSLQLVEEVINQGAMINMPDIVGWTPLHIACHYKRSEVILLLLKHGANLNNKNRDGLFPIDLIENDVKCRDIISNFLIHSCGSNMTSNNYKIIKNKNIHSNVNSNRNDKFLLQTNSDEYGKSIEEFSYSNTDSQNKNNIIDIDKYITNDIIVNDSIQVSENNIYPFINNQDGNKFINNSNNNSSVIKLNKIETEFDDKDAVSRENLQKENFRNFRKSEVNPYSIKNEKSGYNTLNHFSKNKINLQVKDNLNYSFISANSDYVRINSSDDYKNEEKLLKSKQILDRYKVIPKKHKFYETYKNGFDRNKNCSELFYVNKSNFKEKRKNSDVSSNIKKAEVYDIEKSKKNKSNSVTNSGKRLKARKHLKIYDVESNNKMENCLVDNPFEEASNKYNHGNSKNYETNKLNSIINKNEYNSQSFLIKLPNAFPDTNNVDKINTKNSQIIELRNSQGKLIKSNKNDLIKSNLFKSNKKSRSNSFGENIIENNNGRFINNLQNSNQIYNIKNIKRVQNPKIQNYKSKDFIFKSDKNFNFYSNLPKENSNSLKENYLYKTSANFQSNSILKNDEIPNYEKHIPYCNIDLDCEKYQIYDSLIHNSDDSFVIDESSISKDNYTINYPKQKDKEGSIYFYKRCLKDQSILKSTKIASKNYHIKTKTKFNIDKSQEIIFNTSDEEEKSDENYATPVKNHIEPTCIHTNPQLETEVDNSFILSEEIAVAVMKTVKKYKNIRNPLSLAESVPNISKKNFGDAFIYNKTNKIKSISKKIIENAEFENLLKKIKLSEIFFEIFEIPKKEMENVLVYLYLIDPKFALLFIINLYKIENKYEKIPNLVKNEISDKFLRGLILLSFYENEQLNRNIFTFFLESFENSQTNFIHFLKKSLKCFTLLNMSDFLKIDEISRIIANCLYKSSAGNKNILNKNNINFSNHNNSGKYLNLNESNTNEFEKIFKSEHALYMLIFALLVTDLNLKSESYKGSNEFHIPSKELVNKNYYDLIIILKDLNDGKNFNMANLKEYFNFIKVMGLAEFPNVDNLNNLMNEIRKNKMNIVRIFKNGKYRENNYILLKQGFMLLLKNKSKNVDQNQNHNVMIDKIVFLKYDQFYHYKYKYDDFSLFIESKQNRKTILIFTNENNNIGYSKFSSIYFQFNNLENLKNVQKVLSSK